MSKRSVSEVPSNYQFIKKQSRGRCAAYDTMRVSMNTLIAVLAGCALWSFTTESQTSAQPLKTRQITEQPNVPISTQLRPEDQIVLVERAGWETRLVDTTKRSASDDLDLRAAGADLITVAEWVSSDGILVNNESWIRTKVMFRPLRVIKDSKLVLAEAASSLTVFHDGGDVRIGGVSVRAGYFYLYKPNTRYLLFLRSLSKDNNAPFGLQIAVGPDNKLSSMELSSGQTFPESSPLFGLDLDAVIGELNRRLRPKTPK